MNINPTKRVASHLLPVASMGNVRCLTAISYGSTGCGKKAYIQAGLHADEAPGYATMHHLLRLLDAADRSGAITGEIVLVPVANPIGVGQWRFNTLEGRFAFSDGVNFNRQHTDLFTQVSDRIQSQLNASAPDNVALIRKTMRQVLEETSPNDEGQCLKHLLLSLAYDADIVLDLHCDAQALLHVYLGTPLWPEAADLAAQMGSEATLLSDDSGVTPFDEACSRIWWRLSEKFPHVPIPPACLAATIELRGQTDVTHAQAAKDAKNIGSFLQRRGFLAGEAPTLPALIQEATPLLGVEHVKARFPGVVFFLKKVGDHVEKGDVIAEIVNPVEDGADTDSAGRIHPVICQTSGLLFTRNTDCFARPGRILAKIAGETPLKQKGENLLTA